MTHDTQSLWADILAIRQRAPLVHSITNLVAVNTTANALLALGASPVMAHAQEEAGEMAAIAGALVLNIGTLSDARLRAMTRAAVQAQARQLPIVLDPVGAGAIDYRSDAALTLLASARPTLIRANASEIMALAGAEGDIHGVDSTADSASALEAARTLSRARECVVCVSGAEDLIVDARRLASVANGHPMMPRVTALGCTASALCGAFLAVNPDAFAATAHAMVVMGIAGELAGAEARGPGSFQMRFLDALYSLSEEQIRQRAKLHHRQENP